MIELLSESEIEELLKHEIVGRIGCHYEDAIYVVPISYAYDGNYVYAHTYEGMKTDMMRKNPAVCFEVDNLKDMANWQSVIAWGTYEELQGVERSQALRTLLNRPLPIVSSITTHLGENWPFSSESVEKIDGIVFRINLTKKTGRCERAELQHFSR
jgi:nitroimidazol reductase NimA-like FMN-containing flavoprotein (pyridoxamine 5'-phosphate oxidase superfamily)